MYYKQAISILLLLILLPVVLLLRGVVGLESLLDTVLLLTNVDRDDLSSLSLTLLEQLGKTLILLSDGSVQSGDLLTELHALELSFHNNVKVLAERG